MKRTLNLEREALAELATDELTVVAGGAGVPETLNVRECLPSFAVHTCVDCLTRNGC